jgi:glycosyltransferase involved in cell wall biosynthesis
MDVLLAAFAQVRCDDLHLVVLGGGAQVIAPWRKRAEMMGLARSVTFVGVQPDPRPFYWAADGFVFPSRYEVFSMVCLEAAAAQLPLLATRINGTEEFLEDGRNGLVLLPEVDSVASSLDRFRQMSREDRERMGIEARRSVMQFSLANFESAWRSFYAHTPRDASVGGLRSGLGGTGSSNEAARHIVEE